MLLTFKIIIIDTVYRTKVRRCNKSPGCVNKVLIL